MKRRNYSFMLAIFLLVFTACEEDELIIPDENRTFGIRHDRSLAEYEALVTSTNKNLPDFSSVFSFQYSLDGSNNQEFTATGTLIDDNWILTAGHNFFVSDEQDSPAPIRGITILQGNDPNTPDASYEVAELVFHPTWLVADDFFNGNDLCLVKLKTPITDITPATLFTKSNESLGDLVWFCGFGDYSKLDGQDIDLLSKKHASENRLDRKVNGITTTFSGINYEGGLLAFDFDHPLGSINTLGDEIINEEEQLLGAGNSTAEALDFEGTTVQGDSGGPLFLKDGNTWKVAGVLSGGVSDPVAEHEDGSYGDISVFARVSQHIDWIRSVVR
ncbi:MAG: trypsin-like serine protease [Bacteroidota bacterium]